MPLDKLIAKGAYTQESENDLRTIQANTGLSINEYIRVCRLKQAAELLSSQKYKINEVAFMTGFSSPSYFATCFQKQFNLSPSEFVKNLGQ